MIRKGLPIWAGIDCLIVPLDGMVLMDYQPTRGSAATKEMFENFSGYLQSDGYAVYEKIGQRKMLRQ